MFVFMRLGTVFQLLFILRILIEVSWPTMFLVKCVSRNLGCCKHIISFQSSLILVLDVCNLNKSSSLVSMKKLVQVIITECNIGNGIAIDSTHMK